MGDASRLQLVQPGAHIGAAHLDLEGRRQIAAQNMKEKMQSKWFKKSHRQGYKPQFGWDESVGLPWLTIKCVAKKAYPALSGRGNMHLKQLEGLAKYFTVYYERFDHEGYLLMWPEFIDPADMAKPAVWYEFGIFRAFLQNWALKTENVKDPDWRQIISVAFGMFVDDGLDRVTDPLPLPAALHRFRR
ncbi:hypothetical protein BGZ57DRAFT_869050 [Hyaloscypha finlandica]|nr:hypothetical protein BGZ57DRAFT_869050 [Hyaloscypha finlandica]